LLSRQPTDVADEHFPSASPVETRMDEWQPVHSAAKTAYMQ
jgi:hypothetical protein